MRRIAFLLFTLLFSSTMACKKRNNDDSESENSASAVGNIPAALVGVWSQACSNLSESQSSSVQVNFNSSGVATVTLRVSRVLNCAVLSSIMTMKYNSIAGAASKAVQGAIALDQTLLSAVYTPGTAEDASIISQSYDGPQCKELQFQAGIATDMTACMSASGDKISYTIFKIAGNQLQLGSCATQGACKTPATRSNVLDGRNIFTKVK